MRVIIKGGVWKNTEDEVLKGAVMKYGKNQWARISSLLNRKTAKQCKARWYEWLDPAIKKTEWSREEDEKLLHLAKLMPTQWRTIAPIVGRTPSQCLERYQRLLDDAEQKEAAAATGDAEGDGAGPSGVPTAEDVRRIRPGEIDPNPEAKPAKPDPIDMDEDEMEMLSEARARLANTQGKKAKRKARERQLEETRRLGFIQKRRELKATGVELKFRPPKRDFNWNKEVPFQIKPAPGFFDTTAEEKRKATFQFEGKLITDMNLKTKAEKEQDLRRKEFKRRQELAKKKGANAGADLGTMLDPELVTTKRRKLALPTPQISESELEELVKLGQSGELARAAVEESDHQSSRGLVSDYGASIQARIAERAAAIQATRTPAIVDNIETEASNLLAMQKLQTPLLGGDNVELREGGTGFDGTTPARGVGATPAAQSLVGGSGIGETPRSKFGFGGSGSTPARTPIRDQLHLNHVAEGGKAGASVHGGDDISHFGDDVMDASDMEKHRLHRARQALERGLAALPAPKNDFEIVIPDVEEEEQAAADEFADMTIDEDASELEKRDRKRQAELEQERLECRSTVLKRGLPRPLCLAVLQTYCDDNDSVDEVERMVSTEVVRMVNREAYEYPPVGFPPSLLVKVQSEVDDNDDNVTAEMLRDARAMIQQEAVALRKAIPKKLTDDIWEKESDRWLTAKANDTNAMDMDDDDEEEAPSYQSVFAGGMTKAQLNAALLADAKAQFELHADAMGDLSSTCNHLHKQLQHQLAPLLSRAQALTQQLDRAMADREEANTELRVFEALHVRERGVGVVSRVEALEEEVKVARERERLGQERFKSLQDQLKRGGGMAVNGR